MSVLQPADLQLYHSCHKSTEKRRRLSIGQTPITPAKAETKADNARHLESRQAVDRPESPVLELSEGEDLFEDMDSNFELTSSTRIKVWFQMSAELPGVTL